MSDDELVLIVPLQELKEEILQYKEEHFEYGDTQVHGSGGLAYYDDFDDWLEHIDSIRKTDNVASAKTAMSCGGILVKEFTEDGIVKQHYHFELNCL